VPGSEHISPVSCTASYPPGMDAAAAAAAGITTNDIGEDSMSDVAAEPASEAEPEMDGDKDELPADVKTDDGGTEQPVSEQGKLRPMSDMKQFCCTTKLPL